MRAATQTSYGSPEVLSVTDRARPAPGPREILVEQHASAVTQGDRRLREADFPGASALFGRLMFGVFGPRHATGGGSFSGRVVEVGAEVRRFAVGDEVFGSVMHGAYAEYLVVKEDEAVAHKPQNRSHAEVASMPYGVLTAWVFLFEMAKVQRGERVLIVGATGGVGRMAVQVASHLGAHVTAVGSRDEALVRSLGADAFVDYTAEDVTTRDERWDVVFDTSEGANFRRFRGSLNPTGRYLTLYASVRVLWEMALTRWFRGPRAMVGVAMGTPEQMDTVRHLVEAGAVRPVIAERHPLTRIADAHAALERGRLAGDIVVEVRPDPASPRRADGNGVLRVA
ncbi:MAG: NAD(P)-dependent alcohol dehydrogenase [Sandaracinaceae bacterium]